MVAEASKSVGCGLERGIKDRKPLHFQQCPHRENQGPAGEKTTGTFIFKQERLYWFCKLPLLRTCDEMSSL